MYVATLQQRRRGGGHARRGKALVLLAIMLPMLCGAMALAVDTGIIGTARSQLRTVSDAAALAGTMELVSPKVRDSRLAKTANMSTLISTARGTARTIGQGNKVLVKAAVLKDNASNDAGGDVVVGYKPPLAGGALGAFTTDPSKLSLFNSVRVRAQKTTDRGGLIPTPFGSLLGTMGTQAAQQSTATVRNFKIQGYARNPNMNVNLLPIVLDKYNYDRMVGRIVDANITPSDQYTYNPTTRQVSNGPDGVPESLLYGVKKVNIPGNWGTVKIGVNNNSTSTLGNQIRYGITPQQMANMGGKVQLNPVTNTLILEGNPGLSAGIKDDLEAIIGKPVTIPIYLGSGGNGNNAWYEIVEFGGVRIVKVELTGNNKHVIVQPAFVDDPNVIIDPGKEYMTFTEGGALRLHLSE